MPAEPGRGDSSLEQVDTVGDDETDHCQNANRSARMLICLWHHRNGEHREHRPPEKAKTNEMTSVDAPSRSR